MAIPLVMTNVEQKLILNRLTSRSLPVRLEFRDLRNDPALDPVTAFRRLTILLWATFMLPLETASACPLPLKEI